jgi:hypothetical protein
VTKVSNTAGLGQGLDDCNLILLEKLIPVIREMRELGFDTHAIISTLHVIGRQLDESLT